MKIQFVKFVIVMKMILKIHLFIYVNVKEELILLIMNVLKNGWKQN
jgi:hypothetical protein